MTALGFRAESEGQAFHFVMMNASEPSCIWEGNRSHTRSATVGKRIPRISIDAALGVQFIETDRFFPCSYCTTAFSPCKKLDGHMHIMQTALN